MHKKLVHTAVAAATMLILGSERATAETAVVTTQPEHQVAALTGIKATAPTEAKTTKSAPSQVPMQLSTAAQDVKAAQDFQTQVLLTVNGQPITGGMLGAYLAERMQKMPSVKPSPQMQNMILNELINVALLSQVARDAHMDSRPEMKMALELQRDMLLSRMALQEKLGELKPSAEELKKAYAAQYATPTQEYKAAHILVKTEKEAQDIIVQLGKGIEFAVLAKEKSMDSNSKKGGDLGWFEASQMVKPFSDAVAAMGIGTYTHTPVQTQFGWHIIKLEDKRGTTPPTFESIKSRLTVELQRKALSQYVEQLRKQAKIEANKTAPLQATPAPAK